MTAVFLQKEGRVLHVRKATKAELGQQAIYDALGMSASPGGVCKLIVEGTRQRKNWPNVVPDTEFEIDNLLIIKGL